jgi:catecholate siderophore receptor
MTAIKAPRSLRGFDTGGLFNEVFDAKTGRKVTIGCLVAVASVSGAEAQQSPLPPVTVDAPVVRKKPAATKPTAEQLRARAALRAAHAKQHAQQAATANTPQVAPDADPYADPSAPYKANNLSSNKFTQPIVNIPRTIVVLTKELLEDKNATSLKEVGRTTAGVTLGTGEGGNAFGDRFFIRGFDARNDVFVDGIRDPAVNIRENFFTEQIEILKGPSSTVDGRGTTGGALNIVTKQAGDTNFYNAESTLASDDTKRITFDVNQVINPTLSVRMAGVGQDADVSERGYTNDKRDGLGAAVKWTPTSDLKVTANFEHTYLWGLPDFGVPYDTVAGGPVTQFGIPRDNYYGFVNRDFQIAQQDIATQNLKYRLNDMVTLSDKVREERSVLNYIGTIPEQGTGANGTCNSSLNTLGAPNFTGSPSTWQVCLNPLSRYQLTDVLADQAAATVKFWSGPVEHTIVTGTEFSRERVSIDSYTGLNSEAVGSAFANGAYGPVSILNPPDYDPAYNGVSTTTGDPNLINVYTKSLYALETANYQNYLIFNSGLRFDQTNISAEKNGYGEIAEGTGTWNYNLGLVYKPIPITSLYAAYGTGSDPVGAELDGTSTNYGGLSPTSPINQIFGPVESKAAEVGNKWELFDKHLLVTGALFRTDVSNARELVGSSTSGTITAGAAYHVQGIDLGATGNITDRLSIYSGLVLMNTRVDKSAVPTNIGLPLAFVANQSFNVLTKYKINDFVEVGGQATYRSKTYGGTLLAANAGTVLPDYWRFDTFVSGKVNKNWKWKVFVNNIFDKLYYDAFYQSGAPFVLVAPGRVVGIELAAKY